MNKIYRVVFNQVTGLWQVVSECARARGKSRSQRDAAGARTGAVCMKSLAAALMAMLAGPGPGSWARSNPGRSTPRPVLRWVAR